SSDIRDLAAPALVIWQRRAVWLVRGETAQVPVVSWCHAQFRGTLARAVDRHSFCSFARRPVPAKREPVAASAARCSQATAPGGDDESEDGAAELDQLAAGGQAPRAIWVRRDSILRRGECVLRAPPGLRRRHQPTGGGPTREVRGGRALRPGHPL